MGRKIQNFDSVCTDVTETFEIFDQPKAGKSTEEKYSSLSIATISTSPSIFANSDRKKLKLASSKTRKLEREIKAKEKLPILNKQEQKNFKMSNFDSQRHEKEAKFAENSKENSSIIANFGSNPEIELIENSQNHEIPKKSPKIQKLKHSDTPKELWKIDIEGSENRTQIGSPLKTRENRKLNRLSSKRRSKYAFNILLTFFKMMIIEIRFMKKEK